MVIHCKTRCHVRVLLFSLELNRTWWQLLLPSLSIGVLGKVSRKEKTDGGLNIQRSDGDLSSHLGQILSLGSNPQKRSVKVFGLMPTSCWTWFRTWSCLVRLFRNLLSLLPIRSLPWPEPGETLAGRQPLPFLLIACPLTSCNIVWQKVQSKDGHWIVLPWLYQLSCQHVKSVLGDWSDKNMCH